MVDLSIVFCKRLPGRVANSLPRKSRSGLDLLQVSGFTVVADKLNQADGPTKTG
jgi:hypothetical protein